MTQLVKPGTESGLTFPPREKMAPLEVDLRPQTEKER